ncbi:hypothetical protein SAMN06265219_11070 [Gracilimonas mengyeensis]|uniref:Uncharacterized protein n=1 Tax=Gracilimonas mengyeensis TaxID=1302730 RepID=A0A521E3Z9_9BACT|nr:hypothetical protein SAMN06265219_11070 [Gracilimonas mengyeensis]
MFQKEIAAKAYSFYGREIMLKASIKPHRTIGWLCGVEIILQL